MNNELKEEAIYEGAVCAYVFAHSVIWPDRHVDKQTICEAIETLAGYLRTWDDLPGGAQMLYKYVLLVVVNEKQWINRAPQPSLMLLKEYGAAWRIMKLKFLRRLHREISQVNSVAGIMYTYHTIYMYRPNEEVREGAIWLGEYGHRYWGMRFERAIAAQKKIFGDLTLKELVRYFTSNTETNEAIAA